LLTFIAMSSIPASELAAAETPLALVLGKTIFGTAGGSIVKIGIMISVMGASLSWILLSVETMYAAAKDGVMPRVLAKVNTKGMPANALLLTQGITQIFLFAILSSKMNSTYLAAITIATTLVLIPYLLSSLYAVKISILNRKRENPIHFIIALLGTIYAAYVIYAVGLKYLFLSILFYGIGSLLFLKAKKEKNEQPKRWEWAVMAVLLCGAAVILVLVASGRMDL